ncbi:MAG: gamma-glutamyltransferase [Sulfurifustis sp.]
MLNPPYRRSRSIVVLLLVVCVAFARADDARPSAAAIATAHPIATAAGREILEAGGNAFDAAVAVAATLAVVEPFSSGLGGGGFFLLHRARDKRDVMIDARERAPGAARADMFLDKQGQPIPRASLDGPLAAAIPGVPAGLVHLAQQYGKLPLARSLAPAVRAARDGFPVTPRYRFMVDLRGEALRKWSAGSIFLDHGHTPAIGYRVRQPDLARTLESLGRKGARSFYEGEVARRLVEGVRAAGGNWTAADLREYRVIEREPIRGSYRGARITSPPLPSSGGFVLLETLGVLERLSLDSLGRADRAHLIVEAMRRAYRDRAVYLGDPKFIGRDPAAALLEPQRLAALAAGVDASRATPSASLRTDALAPADRSTNTTHFSIIDTAGNRVAATLSINTPFGSCVVPPGTGVVLNNEMDDFASAPDVPNVYGLTGDTANAIAPGKRPLSSMTPVFVETPDTLAIVGTPGGSRIITMVLLATLDFVNEHGSAEQMVRVPRFHHQYLPDEIQYEPGAFTPEEIELLQHKGHRLKELTRKYGNMEVVVWNRKTGRVDAAADPRGEGEALVFMPKQSAPARAAGR